jgi:hypothetical protein
MEAEVRHYPRAVFPSLWQRLETLIRDSDLVCSEEVLVELGRVDDDLYDWCRAHPHMFQPSDAAIQRDVARLQQTYAGFVPTTGSSRADPFVIAVAIRTASAVVTQERPANPGARPKIPDVCTSEGVRCLSLLEMIRAEGWTF